MKTANTDGVQQRSSLLSPPAQRCEEHINVLLARCLFGRAPAASRELTAAALWDRAACLACTLGVGGALDETLREQAVRIPDSARAILTAYREHLGALNAYQVERAGRALDALAEAGVAFLLLKGAALNATLYERADVRGMSDIDVLIRPGDVERADRALQSAGCARGADPVRADFFPRFYYEREYLTGDYPPVRLDVHVRPFRPLRYAETAPPEALWDHPDEVSFGGRSVAIPNRENMLIHLCVHAACHGFGHLRWDYDIKKFVEVYGPRIDWDTVERCVRQWRLAYPMRRALEHVAGTFGRHWFSTGQAVGRVSPAFLRRLPPVFGGLNPPYPSRPGFKDWLALVQAPRDAAHPLSHVVTNLICLSGVRARASYLSAVTFPARAHMARWYRRRHPGWLATAHLTRTVRGLLRAILPHRGESWPALAQTGERR